MTEEDGFSGWSRARLEAEVALLRQHLASLLKGDHGGSAPETLSTVRVPEAFAPPFKNAQQYVGRYFDSLVRDPERATIAIAGERYILLRAASMSVEFVELVTSLYQDRGPKEAREVADNLLFDLAHALGKADALSFQDKMAVTDPIARLSAGPVHFAFSGWAFVDIHPDSSPSPDEHYFLHYDHPYSFESHSWLAKNRTSDRPVCVMNAGYSSGWCEESFGLPLVAVETECVAAGGEHCRFVMAPPSQIEAHLERLGYADRHSDRGSQSTPHSVAVPEFFQRRRLEDELRQANARLEDRVRERTAELTRATEKLSLLARAVDHAVEGIVTLDADGQGRLTFRTANRGFVEISGIPEDKAIGQSLDILGVIPNDQGRLDRLTESITKGRAGETELIARRPDGTEYTLELHLMPGEDRSAEGPPALWIGLFRDVTRRRRHLAELRRQATFDALTDLPNRVMLFDRLEQEVELTAHSGEPLALMVIDLDGFKEVNDTFGHHAGDALLERVGPRLKSAVRKSDLVSRLGGDEFAILMPGVQSERRAVEHARAVLEELHEPFPVAGQELVIGASIGIVLCPQHGTDASSLLRRADVAMYVAKETRTGLGVYRPEDDVYSPERLALVGELRTGIDRGELRLEYQPQRHLASGACHRVEALVRWQHPEQGLLQPGEFVPFIELGNLVERLTDWVLEQAVRDCAAWVRQGLDLGIAINIAPRSVRDSGFPDRVMAVLGRHGLAADRVTLEVTEGGLLLDPALSLPVFESLRAAGIRLAIDDFGTGYSSFAHLRALPVDEIKVDRTFVKDLVDDRQDAAIVQSTIQLGRSIGRTIVAEGVEDAPTLERLMAWGCDQAQGYFIARPMSADRLVEWLAANS